MNRGLVPPGYKYLGPFNSLNKGKPKNYNDYVALIHDIQYNYIQNLGYNPYTKHNDADEHFLQNIQRNAVSPQVAASVFGVKKIGPKLNLTDKEWNGMWEYTQERLKEYDTSEFAPKYNMPKKKNRGFCHEPTG